MIKVELHAHTSDDPRDFIQHSARELIDRAAADGYRALAITLHDRYTGDRVLTDYADSVGVTLIPAVERTIEGRHVLLVNFPPPAARVSGFDGVRTLKRSHPEGLVIAPHPWFPLHSSLGPHLMHRYADLWDAVEINGFFVRGCDFNRPAWRWAQMRGLPLVGNGDVHQLDQLGTTFSLVDLEGNLTPDAVCERIRVGRVEVHSRPLSYFRAARIVIATLLAERRGRSRPITP